MKYSLVRGLPQVEAARPGLAGGGASAGRDVPAEGGRAAPTPPGKHLLRRSAGALPSADHTHTAKTEDRAYG